MDVNVDANENKRKHDEPNLQGDKLNIVLLIFMYTLQFIPRGLILAIPLILQKRKATYTNQAEFSFVSYPTCLRLLWAPIVDCLYSKKVGRRKTWLLPSQYLLGIVLLFMSVNIDDWLGSEDGARKPKMSPLIIAFSIASFLSATQDIAVDGWSLTMLQKKNVGYSSTCNNVGSLIGSFLGFVLFIVLDSNQFANLFRSTPQDYGFISFSDFLFVWFVIYTASTTLIWIFKDENSPDSLNDTDSECRLSFTQSYRRLWQICKIKPVQNIAFILLTCSVAFGTISNLARLKLMDAGVPADKFALMTVPSMPFVLVLPFLLSHHLTGHRCLRTFHLLNGFSLILIVIYTAFIFLTPYAKNENQLLPTWYYWLLVFIYNFDHMAGFTQRLAVGAFLTRVSDSRFGGMYVTLFSSLLFFGSKWPTSVCLWLVDFLTVKSCIERGVGLQEIRTCNVILDGFYTETGVCIVMGIFWLFWSKKHIYKLENLDASFWIVQQKQNLVKDKQLLTSGDLELQA